MTILETVGAFVAGGLGWVTLEFIGRPIRKFFDLRGEIIRQMTFFANVPARWSERYDPMGNLPVQVKDLTERDEARLTDAEKTFRDLEPTEQVSSICYPVSYPQAIFPIQANSFLRTTI